METINFTFYNEATQNNIAGLTYLPPNTKQGTKYNNNTPFHFVFAHATGFCKEVYVDLVQELRSRGINSPITSIDHANHGDSTKNLKCDWRLAALDLYAVIENVIRPNDPNKILIGIGHSMGGALSALVEAAHPKTYGALILLEPIVPPPPFHRPEETNLSLVTMKRKSVFPDKESAKLAFSLKPPFDKWTKGSLDSYVEHGLKQSVIDGKEVVELKAAKEAEAEFYRMGGAHGGHDLMLQITTPFLILRGNKSTIGKDMYAEILAKNKYAEYEELIGSHFFPFETPNIVADKIVDFVKKHVKTGTSKL
eukprot:Phypoly_transcript_12728.p1 GENE.Phypoly_transcript_12728~~Phypoly_transcript_12728.p1  ORF type:complete len:309 (+),score=45.25 Phypoly_transcript_12728:172-1098(+)